MAVRWQEMYDGGHEGVLSPATHAELRGTEEPPTCKVARRGVRWVASVMGIETDGTHHTAQDAKKVVSRVDADRRRDEGPGTVAALGLDPALWTLRETTPEVILEHRRHRGVEVHGFEGNWWVDVDDAMVGAEGRDLRGVVAAYDASDAAALDRKAAHGRELTGHAARMARDGDGEWFLDVRDRLVLVDRDGTSALYVIAGEDGFAVRRADLAALLRRNDLAPGIKVANSPFTTAAEAVGHAATLAHEAAMVPGP